MTALHISVSRFLEMSENRSKSARVHAICAQVRTRRAALFLRFARNGQFLSRRDLPRSADHRLPFRLRFRDRRSSNISMTGASSRFDLATWRSLYEVGN